MKTPNSSQNFLNALYTLALGLLLPTTALADAPTLMTYQGRLKESNSPVTGVRSVEIVFCPTASGGGCLAGTGPQNVTVTNGVFRTTFTITAWDPTVTTYLEARVAGSALSPREQLTSAPYALHATIANGSIDSTKLASSLQSTLFNKTGDTMTGSLIIDRSTLTVNGPLISTGTTGGTVYSGGGTRFQWIPNQAALRAGAVSATAWDSQNIAPYSVAFGFDGLANGLYSTVSGGSSNQAGGQYSRVGGGNSNSAGGISSSIGGGSNNGAAGQYATVAGGRQNTAFGDYSFAGGWQANVSAQGSFIWADSNGGLGATLNIGTTDQFVARAQGGIVFGSSSFTLLASPSYNQALFYVDKTSAVFGVRGNFPQGTSGIPSIGFAGDGGASGFYQPTSNIIALATFGTERWRVTSGGNMGINTQSPQTLLHMSSGTLLIDGNVSPSLQVGTNSFVVTNTGVGIGTLTPAINLSLGSKNDAVMGMDDTALNTGSTITVRAGSGAISGGAVVLRPGVGNPMGYVEIAGGSGAAHLRVTQNATPGISAVGGTCGTGPTASISVNSTDMAGQITINTGTAAPTLCTLTVSFVKGYAAPPKAILLTPASQGTAFISASAVGSFTITVNVSLPSTPYPVYYFVVE